METSSALQPLLWGATTVLAVSAFVFLFSLNALLNVNRPVLLRVVWISGSVAVAALAAVVLVLIQG
jgi:hypothetical protein